jgi:hypothetical protein
MVTKHEDITSTVDFEAGLWVFNVPAEIVKGMTCTLHVNRETLKAIAAHDGTAYWASEGEVTSKGRVKGEAIEWKVQEPHEFGEDGREAWDYRATFERFAVALVEVATGQHDLNDAIEEQALRVLMGRAAAGEDHEVNDCIIQVALFGKVIYG